MNLQKNIREKPFFSWKERNDRVKMADLLLSGAVLAGYSDTVYGLLTSVSNDSKSALNRIKQRKDKPYIVLTNQQTICEKIDNKKLFSLYIIQKLLWPGPLTVITDLKGFNACAYSQEGLIALRVPDHDGLQELIALAGPLFSTSANIAGEPVPQTFDQLDERIAIAVDGFIVENGSCTQEIVPSTIIKLVSSGYEVIREGAVSTERLRSLLS